MRYKGRFQGEGRLKVHKKKVVPLKIVELVEVMSPDSKRWDFLD